jgi:hypothetical protein
MGHRLLPLPMETLLLTKADFADFADLPESLDMSRMRPHILAAQRMRLRPLLLDALTNELLRLIEAERNAPTDNPAPLVFPWSVLRTKSVAVVACAALARYMPFAQQTAVSNGFAVKTSQYSQPADGRDLARQASIYDGDALSYEVALAKWLKANGPEFGSFYPQASCCGATTPSRTPSVVVQGIRRLDEQPRPRRQVEMEMAIPATPTPPATTPQPSPDDSASLPASPYAFTNESQVLITHNLGRLVQVQVTGTDGQPMEGSVSYPDLNTVMISFSPPTSGTVVLL